MGLGTFRAGGNQQKPTGCLGERPGPIPPAPPLRALRQTNSSRSLPRCECRAGHRDTNKEVKKKNLLERSTPGPWEARGKQRAGPSSILGADTTYPPDASARCYWRAPPPPRHVDGRTHLLTPLLPARSCWGWRRRRQWNGVCACAGGVVAGRAGRGGSGSAGSGRENGVRTRRRQEEGEVPGPALPRPAGNGAARAALRERAGRGGRGGRDSEARGAPAASAPSLRDTAGLSLRPDSGPAAGQSFSCPPRPLHPAGRRRSLGPSSPHAPCQARSPALVADAMGAGSPAVAAR